MFITNRLYFPRDVGEPHHALGVYTDPSTHRLYIYAPFKKHEKKWKIFRFAVDREPLKWERVGNLDIKMENVCISPCGRYFWSLEIADRVRDTNQHPLFFRQVDIRTLAYEDFETPAITFDDELRTMTFSARFQHTSNNTFLFVKVSHTSHDDNYKSIDEIFSMSVDQFPKLPTGHFYPTGDHPVLDYLTARWRTGLIEHYKSIYFYRIDYFGDLHVLNWQPTGHLNWTKFSLTGNYRPLMWIESDKRNVFAAMEDLRNDDRTINRLCNSKRFFLGDGIVYEYAYPEGTRVFYQLKFHFATLICECSKIFDTTLYMNERRRLCVDVNKHDGSRMFFLDTIVPSLEMEPLVYEFICVGQVPMLKDLAYWAVRDRLRPKSEDRRKLALNSIINRVIRLVGVKRRTKKFKENPNWPERKSFLVAKPKNPLYSVNRTQIIYLLRKLTKK